MQPFRYDQWAWFWWWTIGGVHNSYRPPAREDMDYLVREVLNKEPYALENLELAGIW